MLRIEASNEDLRNAGPNLDFELWQPASKAIRKHPMTPRGIETGIGALSWQIWTALVCMKLASDGKTGCRQLEVTIMGGHQEPLMSGVALAVVLDLSVNEQDDRLTSCPKNRVHLTLTKNQEKKPAQIRVDATIWDEARPSTKSSEVAHGAGCVGRGRLQAQGRYRPIIAAIR